MKIKKKHIIALVTMLLSPVLVAYITHTPADRQTKVQVHYHNGEFKMTYESKATPKKLVDTGDPLN